VLLLDLVLGYGCHPDPAGPTVDAVGQARAKNPTLLVVASVTGTDLDPQGLSVQQDTLREAGVQVMPSNVAATTLAAAVIRALEER
jgi:FdrA protein